MEHPRAQAAGRALWRRRVPPRVRLALLAIALLGAFLAFSVLDVISKDAIRAWIEPAGALAPAVFVAAAALLGALMVPGPLLAGASGILFGTAAGFPITLAAAAGSGVIALILGRAAGADALDGARPSTLELVERLRRHGTKAVVVQRLIPGVPDAPCSYLAGVAGLRAWQIALGTVIGSAPRAFSYTALGDALGSPPGWLAASAAAVLALAGLAGILLARRAWVRRPRT